MITVAMLATILPIIAAGTAAAAYVAVDHDARAATRAKELAAVDNWLQQIRATR